VFMRGYSTCMIWDGSARMTFDAAMTSDHISARTTYVMWREEHLWNVTILQRVHLSNVVLSLIHFLSYKFRREGKILI
jgi:hypothetical protein